jgi:hypothetical protein
MSTEQCLTPIQFNSYLEKLSGLLMQHYEKNIETSLNTDDEEFLNMIADKLNQIANSENIKFNKQGFKTFVKKIFVYDFIQFGGNGDNIVPYSNKKINPPNMYDFFAIIMMIASIFLLYISFVKFNDLSQTVTGMPLSEISQDIQSQIQNAISKVRELPVEQITFVQYVWNSIQTFSCSLVETQASRIKNIVTESLSNMVVDFTLIAEKTCMPRTEIIAEGAYTISSSYTGSIDLGKTMNQLIQTASAMSTSAATSSCITNTALALQQKAITDMFNQRTLILNQLTAQSSQAISFFMYGASMGASAGIYLLYRTKDVIGIAFPQFKPQIKSGGKYTKNNKKYRKTHRKYRKTHRKYRKTYRKYRKTHA